MKINAINIDQYRSIPINTNQYRSIMDQYGSIGPFLMSIDPHWSVIDLLISIDQLLICYWSIIDLLLILLIHYWSGIHLYTQSMLLLPIHFVKMGVLIFYMYFHYLVMSFIFCSSNTRISISCARYLWVHFQFGSIQVNTDQWDLYSLLLIHIDLYWYVLIPIDLYWSALIFIDPIDQHWSAT